MVAVQTGKVVGGVIVVDNAEELTEGETVTVLLSDHEPFELTPEQEQRLLKSIAQADRGELISSEELSARLRRR